MPQKQRYLVIFNGISGRIKVRNRQQMIHDFFQKKKYFYHFVIIGSYGHDLAEKNIKELIKSLGITRIVVSGGDGTLQSVIQHLYEEDLLDIPLVYLPGGSANFYAYILGQSNDFGTVLNHIPKAKPQKMSFGVINEKVFMIAACFGKVSQLTTSTNRAVKKTLGFISYLLAGVHLFTPFKIKTGIINKKAYLASSLLIVTPQAAHKYIPLKNISKTELNILCFQHRNVIDHMYDIFFVYILRQPPEKVAIMNAKKLEFSEPFPQKPHIDGDILEKEDMYKVKLIPKKLTFYA